MRAAQRREMTQLELRLYKYALLFAAVKVQTSIRGGKQLGALSVILCLSMAL